jgi:hypothetical protein
MGRLPRPKNALKGISFCHADWQTWSYSFADVSRKGGMINLTHGGNLPRLIFLLPRSNLSKFSDTSSTTSLYHRNRCLSCGGVALLPTFLSDTRWDVALLFLGCALILVESVNRTARRRDAQRRDLRSTRTRSGQSMAKAGSRCNEKQYLHLTRLSTRFNAAVH